MKVTDNGHGCSIRLVTAATDRRESTARRWIETTLIPVLTDPQRIAAMAARVSAAGAPGADVVLARHVLTAVAERRRLAS